MFNSESLRDLAAWPGRSVVCHPPTFPSDHRVPSTGDAVTIVNCSKDKGIKTAWRCSEQLPDRKFLGVKGGYGYQITPRGSNFEVIPTQSDMRAVWSRTRVLLVPSAYETWGWWGWRRCAPGSPSSPTHTGPTGVPRAAGIFVDRDDTDGWVRELHRLEDPAEYATASAAALARVDDLDPQVSLDRFAAAVEALCGS